MVRLVPYREYVGDFGDPLHFLFQPAEKEKGRTHLEIRAENNKDNAQSFQAEDDVIEK